MRDEFATRVNLIWATALASVVLILVLGIGFFSSQGSTRQTETANACIAAGKNWLKTMVPGEDYADWSCLDSDIVPTFRSGEK